MYTRSYAGLIKYGKTYTISKYKTTCQIQNCYVCKKIHQYRFFTWRHTVTCMPTDAAYQAFWGSSFRSCVCCLCPTMCCLYFLSTCFWRGVSVDVMKRHDFQTCLPCNISSALRLISNRLVGHTYKWNLSQNSVFVADRGFNISYRGLLSYPCLLITG